MKIVLSGTIEKIRSQFQATTRERIKKSEKQVKVRIFELAKEKTDDMFVLFYAFYKDDAYTRRLTIPVYTELFNEVSAVRENSVLFFAYVDGIPVAAVWALEDSDELLIKYSGSVKRGYDLHADYAIIREIILFAKAKKLNAVMFDEEKLFHGMMSL